MITEASWEMRALTAEALLEEERAEVERLRAHIRELEAKLPDEEGGEEIEPEPPENPFTEGIPSTAAIMQRDPESAGVGRLMDYLAQVRLSGAELEAERLRATYEAFMKEAQWDRVTIAELMDPREIYEVQRRPKLGPPRNRVEWTQGPGGLRYRMEAVDNAMNMTVEVRHILMIDGREFYQSHYADNVGDSGWVAEMALEMLKRVPAHRRSVGAVDWLGKCIYDSTRRLKR